MKVNRNQKCSFFSLLAAAEWTKSSEPLLHLSPWQQKTLGLPNNQLATSVTVLACNQVQVAVVDASVAAARAATADHDADTHRRICSQRGLLVGAAGFCVSLPGVQGI